VKQAGFKPGVKSTRLTDDESEESTNTI